MATTLSRTSTLGIAVIFLLNSLALAFLSPQTVKASSLNDETIEQGYLELLEKQNSTEQFGHLGTSDENFCINYAASGTVENGFGWFTVLKNRYDNLPSSPSGDNANFKTAFENLENNFDNGGWAVIQYTSDGYLHSDGSPPVTTGDWAFLQVITWEGTANLVWTPPDGNEPTGKVEISTTGVTKRNIFDIRVTCKAGETVELTATTALGGSNYQWNSNRKIAASTGVTSSQGADYHVARPKPVFISGLVNFNYPANYNGKLIRQTSPVQTGSKHLNSTVELDNGMIKSTADFGAVTLHQKCVLIGHYVSQFVGEEYTNQIEIDEWELIAFETSENYGTVEIDIIDELVNSQYYLLEIDVVRNIQDPDCENSAVEAEIEELQRQNRPTLYRYFHDIGTSDQFDNKGTNGNCENTTIFGKDYYYCDLLKEENVLQDCSVYGWTEGFQRIGCELSNLWVRFTNFMKWLFVPSGDLFASHIQIIKDRVFENQQSFILYPMTASIQVMQALIDSSGNCNINTGNIWGSSSTWNLCHLSTNWPQAWNLATMAFRMIYVLGLIHIIYIAYLRLWSYGQ